MTERCGLCHGTGLRGHDPDTRIDCVACGGRGRVPLVGGGQGRTPEDTLRAASALERIGCLGLAFVLVLAIAWLLGGRP